jgi:hypothetical protein
MAHTHCRRRPGIRGYSIDSRVLKDALLLGLKPHPMAKKGDADRNENPLDEFVIERVLAAETATAARRQSAAIAAFSVALGRIAADALASSGK